MAYTVLNATDTLSDSRATLNENIRRAGLVENWNDAAASFTAWSDDTSGGPVHGYYVDASGGDITVTLPAANSTDAQLGRTLGIYVADIASGGSVTIEPGSGDTIEGAASLVLSAQYDCVKLRSRDGNDWSVIYSTL